MNDNTLGSERILAVINESFLAFQKPNTIQKAISLILPILGKAFFVDRVIFFRKSKTSSGLFLPNDFLEWCREGVSSHLELENSCLEPGSLFLGIDEKLKRNQVETNLVRNSTNEKFVEWMRRNGVLAYLFVPVFVKNRFFGFFTFENCSDEHLFSNEEVNALRAFSVGFGHLVQVKRDYIRAIKRDRVHSNLISNVTEIIFQLNESLEIINLSGPWLKMTGEEIKSCIGKPLFNYFEEEGAKKFLDQIGKREFSFDSNYSLYTAFVNLGKFPYYIKVNVKKIYNRSRVEFIGTITDIHQIQLEFQVLKENESKFKSLVESLGDVFYSLDLKTGQLQFISDKIERFGFKKLDFFEDSEFWWRQIVEEDRQEVRRVFHNFLENKLPYYEMEYRIQKPDGNISWIYDKFGVEFDAQKNAVCIRGSISDVTEQKNKEIQLEQTENRFRIITENLPFPFILSMEEEFKLIYYNFSFLEHFQIRTGEKAAFGNTWIDHLVPKESMEFFENFLRENTNFSNHEILLHTKDGQQWYSVSSQSIPNKLGFARAIVFYNINKRKLSELELIRLNDLI